MSLEEPQGFASLACHKKVSLIVRNSNDTFSSSLNQLAILAMHREEDNVAREPGIPVATKRTCRVVH